MAGALGRMTSSTKLAVRSAMEAPGIASINTEQRRLALRHAAADRRGTVAATAAAQLVHERHEDARSAGADRMPDGNGATVDVDALLVDLEHARAYDRHRRERLVDLDEVEAAGIDLATRARHRLFDSH